MRKTCEILKLDNISKMYGRQTVVRNLTLSIRKNEFVSLLGPSGCGKTTTLRMIGGFEEPDAGKIAFEGRVINKQPPHLRPVNTVFQQYALFPHMSVGGNIAFGMECSGHKRSLIDSKVAETLELVNLPGLQNRAIQSLSGGQQQRVAIARALVNEPSLLLLDEPLGALDLKLRQSMQKELKRIQQQVGITFLYVTHDQEEALSLSDRIAVINEGVLQQWGTPEDIYNEPKNSFVASFVGESNIIPGRIRGNRKISLLGNEFGCVDDLLNGPEDVQIVIRPEDIDIIPQSDSRKKNTLEGTVLSTVFKGVHWEMTLEVNETIWIIHNTKKLEPGENIKIYISPESIHVMFGGES